MTPFKAISERAEMSLKPGVTTPKPFVVREYDLQLPWRADLPTGVRTIQVITSDRYGRDLT